MAVDDTHADYERRQPQWQMMRDVSAGEDAVKDAGHAYLSQLGGQDQDQYAAYKKRASFYNATGRTIDGLSGMIFRKAPRMEAPTILDDFREDVTLSGLPLQGFAEQAVEEVLTTGRFGMMVDFPRIEDRGMTRADAERMNLRPFWCPYKAEDILNWRVGLVGNRTVLLQVRLMEVVTEEGADEFDEDEVEQIRVLELTSGEAEAGPLFYRQRLFRKSETTKKWEEFGDPIVPQMNGAPLDFIPFIFLGPRDTTPAVCKPPLVDLAYVNLSHYRTCADLEHGAHFAALPTPYCFGIHDEHAPTAIGPEALWTSPKKDVTAGMLEFTGQGLEPLEKRREVKEGQMASLGARMLAPEKRMVEAAETAAIHRHGEISVLASISQAVSAGLTQALEIARDWMGTDGDAWVALNEDFVPTPMSPQMLTALFNMVQGGRISQRTFFDNLQRGEVIDGERDFDEEQDELVRDAINDLDYEDEDETDETRLPGTAA